MSIVVGEEIIKYDKCIETGGFNLPGFYVLLYFAGNIFVCPSIFVISSMSRFIFTG